MDDARRAFRRRRRARRPMRDLDDARRRRPRSSSHADALAVVRRAGRREIGPRAKRSPAALSGARFEVNLSTAILQEMWEKWAFIATGAGITCLMRAAFGDIVAAGAARSDDATCSTNAAPLPRPTAFRRRKRRSTRSRGMFTAPGSTISASMLRDIERGAPIEADHVVGDLLRRGDKSADISRCCASPTRI